MARFDNLLELGKVLPKLVRSIDADCVQDGPQLIDNWLGADSTRLLGGNFRKANLSFI